MRDEFFSYGLEDELSPPWIPLSQVERTRYLTPPKSPKILRSRPQPNPRAVVMQMAIDESQQLLASISSDGKVSVWNLLSGKLVSSYSHDSYGQSVKIAAEGVVISGSADKKIKLWNTSSNQLIKSLNAPDIVGQVAVSSKTNYLAAGINYMDRVIVWNLKSFKQLTTIQERFFEFDLLDFNETGELLYARFGLGENRVWKMPDGELIRAFPDSHYGERTYSSIDKRGKILATSSDRQNEVYLWNTFGGERIQVIESIPSPDFGPFDPNVLLNENGNLLITAALDGKIRIWAAESGDLLQELTGEHENEIYSLAISNKYLVSGDYDGVIKIWEFDV